MDTCNIYTWHSYIHGSLGELSIPVVEITKFDDSSHEYGVLIFIRCDNLGINEEDIVIDDKEGKNWVLLYINQYLWWPESIHGILVGGIFILQ